MRKEQTHMNRMWWMASAVVLLFVALAVVPVAASNAWSSNNDTFIIPANGIRTHGDNDGNDHDFSYNGNGSYYFWMVNGTQGMNAIHITNSFSSPYGQLTNSTEKSHYFYVSSTGGHTGDDAALLLIAVNSTNQTDLAQFAIQIDAKGYNWDPLAGAVAPDWFDPGYDDLYYNYSTVSRSFNVDNYLENTNGDVTQRWKFAPLDNYPIYGGQDMAADKDFKLILVDLNAGLVSNRWANYQNLKDYGTINVSYSITSTPKDPMNVTFNTYVYNWDAPQAKGTIHWLNALSGTAQSGYQVILPGS
ncbi:hypothetical protein [Methanoregula formicica]|uniref:Uncharacterized protein n=1 Tax=Methanoregula formicica (strain DSM 22288 / NBRC 105244 / SMSP) TaxID=593750 RepID=L0HAN9_METFS|nr:hypothetical protein [Methanoregula formicica]AGB01802.1 hypothetical protein Metfor_0742 [Methanoregula formicica SMSP]